MTLKLRTTLAVLALFLVALWVLAGVAVQHLRSHHETQMAAQQFTTVTHIAQSIDNAVKNYFFDLNTLATGLPAGWSQSDSRSLSAWLAEHGQHISPRLLLVSAQGKVLAATNNWENTPLPLSHEFLSRITASKGGAISRPYPAPNDIQSKKTPLLIFGVEASDRRDGEGGFLLASLSIDDPTIFSSTTIPQESNTGVLIMSPQDNLFISASDPTRWLKPLPPPGRNLMHDRYMAGYEGSGIAVNSRGEEELSSAHQIPTANWFVVVTTPTQIAFATPADLQGNILSLALVLSLAVALLTWIFMRNQLAPLENLSRRVANANLGDTYTPIPLEGSEEIRNLTHEFNSLHQRLIAAMETEVNALLERRRDADRLAQYNQSIAMLDNSVVGITYLQNRRMISCNPRFEQMFGYSPGELIGQSTEVIYSSYEEFEQIGNEAYAEAATGVTHMRELWLRRKDGSLFWGMLSGRALNPDAPHDGSIWVYQDMTLQKNQYDELQKFARAVEQSPVSIVITDSKGTIEYINPAFTRVTGYSCAEAIGNNPRMMQSGETPPETYQQMWGNLMEGRQWRGILKNRRKDGTTIWEEIIIGPLADADGHTTHYIAVKEDISARRLAEDQLHEYRQNLEEMVEARTHALAQALDEARAAERAKDEFLANMSHEIRTPLNAIIGLSGLALRTSLDTRQKDYLAKIHDSGEHLLGVINDILDLSKITAGHLTLDEENFVLAEQIDRVLALIAPRATEKKLVLESNIADDVPLTVHGDALRLNQVLMNLVGNAVKFTSAGTITISVAVLERSTDTLFLRFAVQDTGIGMDEHEVARLFQPFMQADSSFTRKYGGTGLGLAICKRLVEKMGGTISAESRKNTGSIFTFTLRLAPGNLSAGSRPSSRNWRDDYSNLHFENVRVLIVDDQAMNRQVAVELLDSAGIQTDAAADGREALEKLARAGPGCFDIVLMDLQMPQLDGLAATTLLRKMPDFMQLPVIAMTAHVMDDERRRCLSVGMNDHIGKPFKPSDLLRIIAAWLPENKKPHHQPYLALSASAPAATPATAATPFPAAETHFAPPGIDVAGALPRFRNNLAKYREWLDRFAADQANIAAEIRELMASGKREAAGIRIHTLKGQAGTLGLTALHAAATRLDAHFKKHTENTAEVDAFVAALDAALVTIAQAGKDSC